MKTDCKWESTLLFIAAVVVFTVALLTGCGNEAAYVYDGKNGVDGAPGKDGKSAPTPQPTVSYTFGSNTTCQKIYTGYSAKKPSNSSSSLRIYSGESCSGSHLISMTAKSNDHFETASFSATLEGTNSTGLTLYVGGK